MAGAADGSCWHLRPGRRCGVQGSPAGGPAGSVAAGKHQIGPHKSPAPTSPKRNHRRQHRMALSPFPNARQGDFLETGNSASSNSPLITPSSNSPHLPVPAQARCPQFPMHAPSRVLGRLWRLVMSCSNLGRVRRDRQPSHLLMSSSRRGLCRRSVFLRPGRVQHHCSA